MIDPRLLCWGRMTQKILLATTVKWPSAAYLAGAFASFGCSVEAVFPRGHALGVSRYLGRAHTYYPLRPRFFVCRGDCGGEAGPDRSLRRPRRIASVVDRGARASDRRAAGPFHGPAGVLSGDDGAQPRHRRRA